jgi:hypothetical protein
MQLFFRQFPDSFHHLGIKDVHTKAGALTFENIKPQGELIM